MQNIDVTLRDGGYRNGFKFDPTFAVDHAQLSVQSGYDWVEIGYLNGSFKRSASMGLTGLSQPNYIESIANRIGTNHVALIGHEHNIQVKDLEVAYTSGARLMRFCTTPRNYLETMKLVKAAKDIGFKVGINLTHVSKLTSNSIVEIVEHINKNPVDVVYYADSNGSLLPHQIRHIVTILNNISECPTGIHAHNHLGMAMSNNMVAYTVGATWFDSSFQGMGKGAGNLISEQWMTLVNGGYFGDIQDSPDRLRALLACSINIKKEIPESDPEVSAQDILTGLMDLGYEASNHFSPEIEKAVDEAIESNPKCRFFRRSCA